MRFIKQSVALVALLALLVPVWARAEIAPSTPPNVIVQQKTDEILKLIEQNRSVYQQDKNALYQMVDRRIVPYFDFDRMSQWVLARYWRTASPAQRTAFKAQFTDLLVRTYATALLSYSGQRISYLPYREQAGSDHALIRTLVIENNGGPNIPIDYSFVHDPTGWKVYDVSIDGVSLITNYRSVYESKIRRDGLDGLIVSMKRVNGASP
ncbi:MAG TPA: ABC transporter substrate-binding protein [Acidiferrobacter sp.]|nr:ABC transporter substrate-binding protein [Acidiferrobacter sp.]